VSVGSLQSGAKVNFTLPVDEATVKHDPAAWNTLVTTSASVVIVSVTNAMQLIVAISVGVPNVNPAGNVTVKVTEVFVALNLLMLAPMIGETTPIGDSKSVFHASVRSTERSPRLFALD
jgi:hypothetical protein